VIRTCVGFEDQVDTRRGPFRGSGATLAILVKDCASNRRL
jgi:hypothetical protein